MLYGELGKHYAGVNIRDMTFNGSHRMLTVDVWVPLRIEEDTSARERLRKEIHERIRATVPKLDDFEKVRVLINSGFQFGIANMHRRN